MHVPGTQQWYPNSSVTHETLCTASTRNVFQGACGKTSQQAGKFQRAGQRHNSMPCILKKAERTSIIRWTKHSVCTRMCVRVYAGKHLKPIRGTNTNKALLIILLLIAVYQYAGQHHSVCGTTPTTHNKQYIYSSIMYRYAG